VVELPELPAGAGAARVSAAATQPHRAAVEGLAVAAGEELAGVGPEAPAGEGGAAVARPCQWGVPGPARERVDVWGAGHGEDACLVRGGPGAGAGGPAGAVHQVQPAGAGVAEGQAGPASEGALAGIGALAGPGDR